MEELKLIVCTHKPTPLARLGGAYLPVMAGNALRGGEPLPEGYAGDDTGDHISAKNPAYSEMTAVYWAWKNLRGASLVGVCHYHRYLRLEPTAEGARRALGSAEAAVAKPAMLPHTVQTEASRLTSPEDVYLALDTLLELHPAWGRDTTDYVFRNTMWTPCNLLLATRAAFDGYCAFMFPLLARLEERLRPYPFSRQRRNVGYLAEMLTGLYFHHMRRTLGMPVRELDVEETLAYCKPAPRLLLPFLRMKKELGKQLLVGRKTLGGGRVFLYPDVVRGLAGDGADLAALAACPEFAHNFLEPGTRPARTTHDL